MVFNLFLRYKSKIPKVNAIKIKDRHESLKNKAALSNCIASKKLPSPSFGPTKSKTPENNAKNNATPPTI